MRNWLETDFNSISDNLQIVRDVLPEDCQIIAVVKANAYGHGDVTVARYLEETGISRFAVASLGEALRLRENGIYGDILVLSYVDPEELADAVYDDITLCGVSYEYCKAVNEIALAKGFRVKMHLKLNTGMNRVGFECRNEKDLELIKDAYNFSSIDFTGIFSHFSSSDDTSEGADEYCQLQLERFKKVISFLDENGIDPGLKHISNSGAIGKYSEARFDAVRCGALMYGYNTAVDAKLSVKPAATWKTVISVVRTLEAGDAVSYSRHFIAKGGEKVATLCVGYADGYKRALSGKEDGPRGYVLINGKRCPIIGNICMDQMMVDVTGLDVKPGDVAILMNDKVTADDLAEWSGTCMHDILASIGERVERVYIR